MTTVAKERSEHEAKRDVLQLAVLCAWGCETFCYLDERGTVDWVHDQLLRLIRDHEDFDAESFLREVVDTNSDLHRDVFSEGVYDRAVYDELELHRRGLRRVMQAAEELLEELTISPIHTIRQRVPGSWLEDPRPYIRTWEVR